MKLSEVVVWTCNTLLVPEFAEMIECEVNGRLQTTMARARMKIVEGVKTYTMIINPELWKRATDQEKKNTTIHEVCHLVEFYVYGKVQRIKAGHGPIWDSYMRRCGLNPREERFHCVECSDMQRRQHRWDATCCCGMVNKVSTTLARRIMNNTAAYRCRMCGSKVEIKLQKELT
jgi:predicted SprT family Zn-dependent metalloprotease